MTTDRERILELLRELMEMKPSMRVGQLVDAGSLNSDAGAHVNYIDDRDLLYGLLSFRDKMRTIK